MVFLETAWPLPKLLTTLHAGAKQKDGRWAFGATIKEVDGHGVLLQGLSKELSGDTVDLSGTQVFIPWRYIVTVYAPEFIGKTSAKQYGFSAKLDTLLAIGT